MYIVGTQCVIVSASFFCLFIFDQEKVLLSRAWKSPDLGTPNLYGQVCVCELMNFYEVLFFTISCNAPGLMDTSAPDLSTSQALPRHGTPKPWVFS